MQIARLSILSTFLLKDDNKPHELVRKETLGLLESNFTHDVISVEEYKKRVDTALNTSIGDNLIRFRDVWK